MEWHTGYSIPIKGSNDIVAGFGHASTISGAPMTNVTRFNLFPQVPFGA